MRAARLPWLCSAPRRALHDALVAPAAPTACRVSGGGTQLMQRRPFLAQPGQRRLAPPRAAAAAPTVETDMDDEDDGDDGGAAQRHDRRYRTQADIDKLGRNRPPQDLEISDPFITVVRAGQISGPLATRHVLEGLAEDESLRTVKAYVRAGPGRGVELAVCKIVNKRDEYERQRRQREEKRETAASGRGKVKMLDLSWGIDEHDLANKLRQALRFIEKGIRVEVAVERKRRSKNSATTAEAAALIKRVREAVAAAGGKEKGEPSGELLRSMRMVFLGKDGG